MADIKQAFGSSTAITLSLASKADNTAQESTAVDNATNLYLEGVPVYCRRYARVSFDFGHP